MPHSFRTCFPLQRRDVPHPPHAIIDDDHRRCCEKRIDFVAVEERRSKFAKCAAVVIAQSKTGGEIERELRAAAGGRGDRTRNRVAGSVRGDDLDTGRLVRADGDRHHAGGRPATEDDVTVDVLDQMRVLERPVRLHTKLPMAQRAFDEERRVHVCCRFCVGLR